MGLNAVVYRNITNIDLGEARDAAKVDAETGEVYFENHRIARDVQRDSLKAAEVRIGNVAEVDALRAEIIRLIGPASQICSRVLHSGSHSGDVIRVSELPALASEVQEIHKTGPASQRLRHFLHSLQALILAATHQGNPIVFV